MAFPLTAMGFSSRSSSIPYNRFLFSCENGQGQGAQTPYIFFKSLEVPGQLPHFTHEQNKRLAGGQGVRIMTWEFRVTILSVLALPQSLPLYPLYSPASLFFPDHLQGETFLGSKKVG